MKKTKRLRYVDYAARMNVLLDMVLAGDEDIELEYQGAVIRLERSSAATPEPHDPEKVREGLRASAGAFKGFDLEEFKRDIREMGYQDTKNRPWLE